MNSLALEDYDYNSSEIAYMGTLCAFFSMLVCSCVFLSCGRRSALISDYGNNWVFLYVCFYKRNPSLSTLLLDTIA